MSTIKEPHVFDHPVDWLEPDNTRDVIHDARKAAIVLINNFAAEIESALSKRGVTVADVGVRFFGCAFACGLNCVAGRSMGEIAEMFGCTRQAISKVAIAFCLSNNLPSSFYQKSERARGLYRDARINSIRNNGQRAKPFKQPPPPP